MRTLDRARMEQLVGQVLELDQAVLEEMGRAYTDEPWEARHFLLEVPGKWELSQAALGTAGLHGFWIASRAPEPIGIYTHRVAVAAHARGSGAAGAMLEALLLRADRSLTLSVATGNEPAIRFYEGAGFRRLEGGGLAGFAAAKGLRVEVLPDRIREENSGHCKYVYALRRETR